MSHDGFEDVVEHIQFHAGDALQAVVIYRDTEYRVVYARNDVASGVDETDLSRIVARMRTEAESHGESGWNFLEGDLRATVRLFDNGVVMHLPRDDASGTVVVLDLEVARRLGEFVEDIRVDLY